MNAPFLIDHPDGRVYEIADPAAFDDAYKAQGFRVMKRQPAGYIAPEKPKPVEKVVVEAEPKPALNKAPGI